MVQVQETTVLHENESSNSNLTVLTRIRPVRHSNSGKARAEWGESGSRMLLGWLAEPAFGSSRSELVAGTGCAESAAVDHRWWRWRVISCGSNKYEI